MALKRSWPVWLVLAFSLIYLGWRLSAVDWQARELAEIGTRFAEGNPQGSEGYDGQFVLYMAEDLNPLGVAPKLDVPAYRYQRILLPFLARLAAFGNNQLVPWTLIFINLIGHSLGVWALCQLLARRGRWVGYSLLYGFWVGLIGGIGTDLHEPVAYGMVSLAIWLRMIEKDGLAIGFLGASLLAKETTLPFLIAFIVADIFDRRVSRTGPFFVMVFSGYAFWQLWLWQTFGQPGLGSGGLGASGFELLPLLGFFRIAMVDLKVFFIYLLLFGPGILLPTIWGAIKGITDVRRQPGKLFSWMLLLNAGVIVVLPNSTFREPFGLVRLATGLILATIVYAVQNDLKRPLNYAWFWFAYLPLVL